MTLCKRIAVVVFVLAAAMLPAEAGTTRADVARRLEEFRQFFVDFQYAPDKGIPGDLLADCHGVIIMRQYKAGFIFGVKGGDGVIFLHDRDTGEWSAPGFVLSGEGSFGFQIGGQAIDAIMLIMNRSGVDMLLKSRFKIGVDASAAAGPVGRNASAKVGPGTAILAYSRSKGLYAGASFEGGAILNHDRNNRAMYGMDIGLRDILINRMAPVPPEALPMIETLKRYSTRTRPTAAPAATTTPNYHTVPADPTQPIETIYPGAVVLPLEPAVSAEEQAALDEAAARAQDAADAAQEAARAAQEAAEAARQAAGK